MVNPHPQATVAIGNTKIDRTPTILSALGAASCFVLAMYDPQAQVGGMAHLSTPRNNVGYLGAFARTTLRQMLNQLQGMGAQRQRLQTHVVCGPSIDAATLRTIRGTLHGFDLYRIRTQRDAGAGYAVRFGLDDGALTIEPARRQTGPRDIRSIALELGSQILDLHAVRKSMADGDLPNGADSAHLLQQVAHSARHILGDASCHVILGDMERGWRIQAAAPSRRPERITPLSAALIDWVADQDSPLCVAELAENGPKPMGAGALISVPLDDGARRLGCLCALRPSSEPFEEEDVRLLTFFAHQATIAIKNTRAYQRLAGQTHELEAILQNIGDGLVVVEPDMRLVMANPTARALLNLSPALSAGDPLPADCALAPLLNQTRTPGPFSAELILGDGATSPTICQATISRIRGATEAAEGTIAIVRDITAQREQQRLRETLFSVVSHELRTPLHSISGFVDIILMGKTGPLTPIQQDFLTTVKLQSTQLQNIINDVLAFTRLEYGQIKLSTEPVQLADIAHNVTRKLALIAQEQEVELVNDIPTNLPAIEGDSVRLEQVLTNLVDNAFKFTPAGGTVQIGAMDRGIQIELWVRDTGAGIPKGEQERIFEKFYQVDEGGRTPRKGAGLGLTICKHIVEQHQGQIWAESEPGRGSTFHLTLPKRIDAEPVLDFARLAGPATTAARPTAMEAIPLPETAESLART